MNHLGINVGGKRKCGRAEAIKGNKGHMLDEFFFGNDGNGIHNLLSRMPSHGICIAVLESTGNMWMRIHDTLANFSYIPIILIFFVLLDTNYIAFFCKWLFVNVLISFLKKVIL